MSRRHAHGEDAEINITPMLDIVFIMLIFFIVTTSFVKETGVAIARPVAEQGCPPNKNRVMPDKVTMMANRIVKNSAPMLPTICNNKPNAIKSKPRLSGLI